MRAESSVNLAVARVTVCSLLLLSEELWAAPSFAASAAWLRSPSEGLGWAVSLLPLSAAQVSFLQWSTGILAFLAALGVATRWTLPGCTALASVLLALPHFSGGPRHSMHLLWFLLVLSFSPCARALSLDACWRAVRPRSRLEIERLRWATRWALDVQRALLALIYFFPGFWKLWSNGFAWALSDNLQNQMYWKWAQFGSTPSFRYDQFPALVQGGALITLMWELAFPVLMFWPRTRWFAALVGIAFHVVSERALHLGFFALWACYVVLVDWDNLLRWLRDAAPRRRLLRINTALQALGQDLRWRGAQRVYPRLLGAVSVGVVLWLSAAVQGVRAQMHAYPVACYPTFQWPAGPTMPDLVITVLGSHTEQPLRDGPFSGGARSQFRWGMAWRAAGVYQQPAQPAQLLGYARELLLQDVHNRALVAGAERVRFYRVQRWVRPERWHEAPAEQHLLLELPAAQLLP